MIGLALDARAPVALLPCCHDEDTCDAGGLRGFLALPLAVDATRVARLRDAGYDVVTQTIPEDITPHNRLILAIAPDEGPGRLGARQAPRVFALPC